MTGARTKQNIHDASIEARLEAYSRANKLFQNFIDHVRIKTIYWYVHANSTLAVIVRDC